MPLHDLKCPKCGTVYENVVVDLSKLVSCGHCNPPVELEIFWRKAPAGFVQRDICYDSPVDGRPVTSKQARIEDLARNECVEWEPGMRQDFVRRREEAETRLDKALDETVEAAIEVMDVRKKEKLEQELRAGASVDVTRPDLATVH